MYFPAEQLAAQGLDPAQVVGIKVRRDSIDGTLAGGAWLLISDNPRYEKELIKPQEQDMKDVKILGRGEIRIGRVS